MSLIYGYSQDDSTGDGDVSDLEKLVGEKTDDKTKDSAFGRIKDNKENISSSIVSTANVVASVVSSLGQKTDDKTKDTAFGRIKENKENISNTTISTANVIASVVSSLGQKTDDKTKDTAFGGIKKNKEDISTSTSFVGSVSSLEGDVSLKGTQLSHASAISAHSGNLLTLESNLGTKADSKSVDSAFGRVQKNKKDLTSMWQDIASMWKDIAALEGNLGKKTDDKSADTAFGRIQKNKEGVGLKETTGTFIAPLAEGTVEISGWNMTRDSTIVAIIIKAEQALSGVSRATVYSGSSWANNNHRMTVPTSLLSMKLGRPAVVIHTRDSGHARLYVNVKGNAIGSVAERTLKAKFVYIDHS